MTSLLVQGLYDIYISNRQLHFLEEEESVLYSCACCSLNRLFVVSSCQLAKDMRIYEYSMTQVMTINPSNPLLPLLEEGYFNLIFYLWSILVTFERYCSIGELLDTLSSCSCHCFPVVESKMTNLLCGSVSRNVGLVIHA